MTHITVKGYLSLRGAMGAEGEIRLQMEGPTIRKALIKSAEMLGDEFKDLIFDSGTNEIKSIIQVLLNGRHYRHLPDRLDTQLADNDIIAVFPPVLGG